MFENYNNAGSRLKDMDHPRLFRVDEMGVCESGMYGRKMHRLLRLSRQKVKMPGNNLAAASAGFARAVLV